MNTTAQQKKFPILGKIHFLDYEDGDLKDTKISSLLNNSLQQNQNLTQQEKVDKLNDNLSGISRTPVKEVEKMTQLAEKAMGIKKQTSNNPIREAKLGETMDANSTKLYDFERVDEKFILIYKDKNNLILKMPPIKYEDIDPSEQLRLTLIKKAKDNKKFRLLLETTDAFLDKMTSQE